MYRKTRRRLFFLLGLGSWMVACFYLMLQQMVEAPLG